MTEIPSQTTTRGNAEELRSRLGQREAERRRRTGPWEAFHRRCRLEAGMTLLLVLVGCGGGSGTTVGTTTTPESTSTAGASTQVKPRPEDLCTTQSFREGQLHVSQKWRADESKCIVMVATETMDGKSRSYLFNSQGMVMTFAVFGDGPLSKNTGGRTHFLLPNTQPLHVERLGQAVKVHTTSGHTVSFDTQSGRPEDMSGGEFQVSANIDRANKGGVTLSSQSGIVLDFGFMIGGSPHGKAEREATLTDAQGRKCTVKNSELVDYGSGEPIVRVSSSQQLQDLLKGPSGQAAGCGELTLD